MSLKIILCSKRTESTIRYEKNKIKLRRWIIRSRDVFLVLSAMGVSITIFRATQKKKH